MKPNMNSDIVPSEPTEPNEPYYLSESDVLVLGMERGLRPTTVRSYVSTLRSLGLLGTPFGQTEVYEALLNLSPGSRRRASIIIRSLTGLPLKVESPISRVYSYPSLGDYRFYRATFKYPDRLDLMAYAGLRLGEACARNAKVGNTLMIRRAMLPDGTLSTPKTLGNVVVPEWLPEPTDFEKTPNALAKAMGYHSKKTGVNISAHMLRSWFATRCIEAGMHPSMVASQLRHSNPATTLRYYVQFEVSQLASVMNELER